MSNLLNILERVDLLRVGFLLEFSDSYHASPEAFLRIRRDLRYAASQILSDRGSFGALLDPQTSFDPVARKRFQRPSLPFVLTVPPSLPMDLEVGDTMELPVLFFGGGVQFLIDLARTFEILGQTGLHKGDGYFDLLAISSLDPSGGNYPIWQQGQNLHAIAPPINHCGWWLESCSPIGETLTMNFLTPARLMSKGKPLFRPRFKQIFPFILRRLTSMVHAHAGGLFVEESQRLIEDAAKLREIKNTLVWQDWRTLEGDRKSQDLGGVMGKVCLEGDISDEILTVLRLGSLLNIGKGSPYGAGHFELF